MTKLRYLGTRLSHPDLGTVVRGQVVDVSETDATGLREEFAFESAPDDAESDPRPAAGTATQTAPGTPGDAAADVDADDEATDPFTALDGVAEARAADIREAGYGSLDALAITTPEELAADVDGLGEETAAEILAQLD